MASDRRSHMATELRLHDVELAGCSGRRMVGCRLARRAIRAGRSKRDRRRRRGRGLVCCWLRRPAHWRARRGLMAAGGGGGSLAPGRPNSPWPSAGCSAGPRRRCTAWWPGMLARMSVASGRGSGLSSAACPDVGRCCADFLFAGFSIWLRWRSRRPAGRQDSARHVSARSDQPNCDGPDPARRFERTHGR